MVEIYNLSYKGGEKKQRFSEINESTRRTPTNATKHIVTMWFNESKFLIMMSTGLVLTNQIKLWCRKIFWAGFVFFLKLYSYTMFSYYLLLQHPKIAIPSYSSHLKRREMISSSYYSSLGVPWKQNFILTATFTIKSPSFACVFFPYCSSNTFFVSIFHLQKTPEVQAYYSLSNLRYHRS